MAGRLLAATATMLLIATADRYDYHRDELYFRLLGQHPQWGYTDQPPFTPLLARLGIEVFGDTVWAMRIPFAILLGVTAIVAAAIARELGGGPAAQSLAAAGVFSAGPLSTAHVSSTATADLLVWLGVVYFMIRALLAGRERAWLAVGLVTGLGLYNKHLVVLLLLCVAAGLLWLGPRHVLTSRWLWAGAGIAVLVALPNLIYQVANDFPQASMAAAIAENKGAESRALLLPLQFVLLMLPPVWIAGIVTLLRDPRLHPLRALAVAYPLMLLLVLATAGQPYYPFGLLYALFAVGSVPTARWASGRRARQSLLAAGVVLSVLMGIGSSLPVIPERSLAGSFAVDANQTIPDQIGWREYVWQIAAVHDELSAADKRRSVLFTGNYGEAGALDRYGAQFGLPAVYSGHNELHNFGPPPEGRTVVVAVLQAPLHQAAALFGACQDKATLRNSLGVENEELEAHIYVCRTSEPWSSIWPRVQHYD